MTTTIKELCETTKTEIDFANAIVAEFNKQSPGSGFRPQNEYSSGNQSFSAQIVILVTNDYAIQNEAFLDTKNNKLNMASSIVHFDDGRGAGSHDFSVFGDIEMASFREKNSICQAIEWAVNQSRENYVELLKSVGLTQNEAMEKAKKIMPDGSMVMPDLAEQKVNSEKSNFDQSN